MTRHLVLVGLPGAGKSTVGRILAGRLARPFVDVDEEIAAAAGMAVPEIFARMGEPGFRSLEREAMRRIVARQAAVIAPGGGWAAEPGALSDVRDRAIILYLVVQPEVAVARLAGNATRPLLAVPDRLATLRRLLAEREPAYRAADLAVAADLPDAAAVAEGALAELRRAGLL
ncbi:MAG: shikimate kinase [Gemmatimonadota bacterium]